MVCGTKLGAIRLSKHKLTTKQSRPMNNTIHRSTIQIVAAACLALLASQSALAAKDPVYTSLFSNDAAGGYDVTAYFSEKRAVKGSKKYSTEYNGARWLFASQENLDLFLNDPEKFAPQYGGYCAWAAAMGDTAKGDPEHWSLHNGKLYLNYDSDIQQRWLGDKENLVREADRQWPTLLN